jgi:peptidoglycan/LPS O-acetylase OafA/YrhL
MSDARLAYLPALDGLRAIAVVLVVAYHLDVEWARGGFLGVDLFFVISGYLITTLLLRERAATGTISLRTFWVRRFRRLVPPLVAMVAVTVALTRLYGIPEQWQAVRWDAASALGYVANWRFVTADQSYFQTLLGPSPLRHTWSLAVEEQWYLLWPLAVVGMLVLHRRGHRRLPIVVIASAALLSATAMVLLYDAADPTRVYFGTDTRAQQLLVGAGLAWVLWAYPKAQGSGGGRLLRPLVSVGLVAFVFVAMTTSDQAPWLYRGGFLLVSVLGALLVWGVGIRDGASAPTWLAWPPLVWIGIRSYAIYLWHWPVILFVGPPMGLDLGRFQLATLQVALTVLLAEATYRFIERPVRRTTMRPALVLGSWTAVSFAVIAVAAIALVPPEGRSLSSGSVLVPNTPVPNSPAPTPPGTSTTVPVRRADAGTAGPSTNATTPTSTTVSSLPAEPRTMLLLGDSTAFALAKAADPTAIRPWKIEAYATLGCGISAGDPIDSSASDPIRQGEECIRWQEDWNFWTATLRPDVSVVMVGAWEVLDHAVDGRIHRFPSPEWSAVVRDALAAAMDRAGVGNTPVAALALPCMKQSEDAPFPATDRNDPARIDEFNRLLREVVAERPNARLLDLSTVLCPSGAYLDEIDGRQLRYDGVHVTPYGADVVMKWLTDQLDGYLEPTR